MPGLNGLEVIERVKKQLPNTPIVLMTAYDEMQLTIKAMQAGAFDYIEKPINLKKLKNIIDTASAETGLIKLDINPQQTKISSVSGISLVGKSEGIREVIKKIGLVSNSRVSVLIKGETGTGKRGRLPELFMKAELPETVRLLPLTAVHWPKPYSKVNFSVT